MIFCVFPLTILHFLKTNKSRQPGGLFAHDTKESCLIFPLLTSVTPEDWYIKVLISSWYFWFSKQCIRTPKWKMRLDAASDLKVQVLDWGSSTMYDTFTVSLFCAQITVQCSVLLVICQRKASLSFGNSNWALTSDSYLWHSRCCK